MGQKYSHLQSDERNTIQRLLNAGLSSHKIGTHLGRSGSTISREIRRGGLKRESYDAPQACLLSRERQRRGSVKLREGSALRAHVFSQIQMGWSPQQISGKLALMSDPALPSVSHETIYRAIYILPRGAIRKELTAFLRQAKSVRGSRHKSGDKRGCVIGMVSIHERPLDVLNRTLAGDWEGDFIKGAGNASAIGTLIERKSRYTILAKMKDCSSAAALEGFTRALRKVPQSLRKSFTYDQGKEMARHAELAERTKIKVYFCDPHSPWQRPSNENMNGLVRQYLPKGSNLSIYSQKDLDKVAQSLNNRPRACLGFRTPQEVFESERNNQGDALQL
jgi:IS30 family transposase